MNNDLSPQATHQTLQDILKRLNEIEDKIQPEIITRLVGGSWSEAGYEAVRRQSIDPVTDRPCKEVLVELRSTYSDLDALARRRGELIVEMEKKITARDHTIERCGQARSQMETQIAELRGQVATIDGWYTQSRNHLLELKDQARQREAVLQDFKKREELVKRSGPLIESLELEVKECRRVLDSAKTIMGIYGTSKTNTYEELSKLLSKPAR